MKGTNRDILKLAIPSILANITIPLVGIVDTAIVGHLSDAAAIGGIAIGTMLFDLLYWNFGFLRVGTSGLTAQAYGAKGDTTKILMQSLSLAGMGTLLVWAIQWFFVTAVLAVVPCSQEVASVAREYFFVRIWAAPATLSLMAFKGWFIGMQDTKSSMVVDIVVNGVNMLASYTLAVSAGLGVVGVALGTVIAQFSGLILAISILFFRYTDIPVSRYGDWKAVLRWNELSHMMALNGNLFIRSLCFMVVYVGFTSLASNYGDTELAVSSIIMKLFMFFSFFVDGFAYAGEALIGKEWGKQISASVKKGHLRAIIRSLFDWGMVVGVIFTFIYAIFGFECFALMTNDVMVQNAFWPYRYWLVAMPIVSSLAFIWDGIYVGTTSGKEIRDAMIWAAVLFVLTYVATYSTLGMQGLYIAYFAHLLARVVYLSVKWNKVEKSAGTVV